MTKYIIILLFFFTLQNSTYSQENHIEAQLAYRPFLAYNTYDGLFGGVAIGSISNPQKSFRWVFSPAYAFESKVPVGGLAIEKDWLISDSKINKIISGIHSYSFSYNDESRYLKMTPYLKFDLNQTDNVEQINEISIKAHLIYEYAEVNKKHSAFQINYSLGSVKEQLSKNLNVALEYQAYKDIFEGSKKYLKLSSEYSSKVEYLNGGRLDFRVFAAGFILNDQRASSSYSNDLTRGSLALSFEGSNDQLYEHLFVGRNAFSGWEANQVAIREGGFKHAFGSQYRIGQSNDSMLALNLAARPPMEIPNYIAFQGFLDLALIRTKETTNQDLKNEFYYSGGISFMLFNDILGIYFPLFYSDQFDDFYLAEDGFFDKVSFNIKLNLWEKFDEYSYRIK